MDKSTKINDPIFQINKISKKNRNKTIQAKILKKNQSSEKLKKYFKL